MTGDVRFFEELEEEAERRLRESGAAGSSEDSLRDELRAMGERLEALAAKVISQDEEIAELREENRTLREIVGLLNAKTSRLDEENDRQNWWIGAIETDLDDIVARMDRGGEFLGFMLNYLHWFDPAAMAAFKRAAREEKLKVVAPKRFERYMYLKERLAPGTGYYCDRYSDQKEFEAFDELLSGFGEEEDLLGDVGERPRNGWTRWGPMEESEWERLEALDKAQSVVQRATKVQEAGDTTKERIDHLLKILNTPEKPALTRPAVCEMLNLSKQSGKTLFNQLAKTNWFVLKQRDPRKRAGAGNPQIITLTDKGRAEANRRKLGVANPMP